MDNLPKGDHPTSKVKAALEPYLYESGIDPDNLHENSQLIANGLMLYHVIDKSHHELDDISQGKLFNVTRNILSSSYIKMLQSDSLK